MHDLLIDFTIDFFSFKNNIHILQAPESKHPWTLVWWSLTSTACVHRTLVSTHARQSTSTERQRQLPASKCRVSKLFRNELWGSKTWQKILSFDLMCAHELQDSSKCPLCVQLVAASRAPLYTPLHSIRSDTWKLHVSILSRKQHPLLGIQLSLSTSTTLR